MNIPPKKKRRVPTKNSHCLRSELAGAKVEQGCLAAAAQLQGKLFFFRSEMPPLRNFVLVTGQTKLFCETLFCGLFILNAFLEYVERLARYSDCVRKC